MGRQQICRLDFLLLSKVADFGKIPPIPQMCYLLQLTQPIMTIIILKIEAPLSIQRTNSGYNLPASVHADIWDTKACKEH